MVLEDSFKFLSMICFAIVAVSAVLLLLCSVSLALETAMTALILHFLRRRNETYIHVSMFKLTLVRVAGAVAGTAALVLIEYAFDKWVFHIPFEEQYLAIEQVAWLPSLFCLGLFISLILAFADTWVFLLSKRYFPSFIINALIGFSMVFFFIGAGRSV